MRSGGGRFEPELHHHESALTYPLRRGLLNPPDGSHSPVNGSDESKQVACIRVEGELREFIDGCDEKARAPGVDLLVDGGGRNGCHPAPGSVPRVRPQWKGDLDG